MKNLENGIFIDMGSVKSIQYSGDGEGKLILKLRTSGHAAEGSMEIVKELLEACADCKKCGGFE